MTSADVRLGPEGLYVPNPFDHSGKHVCEAERDHLVRVGSAVDPLADREPDEPEPPADCPWRDWAIHGIEVQTPNLVHEHFILGEEHYLTLCRAGLIMLDAKRSFFPCYVGLEPLLG